ncbi:ABC transporter substrate-binding protein [Halomonas janggokensis]|jgi:phospholipid transport system substrate-binding protein|uniref:ABC transporter substrate-binding protein n=2 Tax=Oceanospirillales TaxID=135619 RepID=A0ABT4IT71_9GAMM|nr:MULTISPECIES: ABC transporter substrate-binding protein [Halomonas]MCW4148348.1 ABC transporter substrate-binding protein [Halomonas sp. 18H]MCZ0926859.1 ABC transporter substrate-binding protein [Halomonas janggokensis]MCZ0929397.1 ABC transporter substrate-binding protein [Halomonas janggokensis]MDR5885195.1 ABC transporter substrate-binding protein [Halomonas janggokensis]QPL44753.1 ABC transporter substrate-binding protein [Halomonas sp. A40-4]
MSVKKGSFVSVFTFAVALFAAMVPLSASAQPEPPEEMIRSNINEFMAQLEGREAYYEENIDELKQQVDESLEEVADFRYIGASVMGSYFRNASPEQRSRFVDVFRQTLIDTYTRGLVTFDYDDIRVLDDQRPQREEDRASVAMEVVATNGDVYPVNYSLRLSDGEWRVVNVIVNGINLGLTFRNQFDQAMRDNNRDYDAVIDSWAPDVGVDELEAGGDA